MRQIEHLKERNFNLWITFGFLLICFSCDTAVGPEADSRDNGFSNEYVTRIYTINSDTSDPRSIAYGAYPRFTPDGKYIVYYFNDNKFYSSWLQGTPEIKSGGPVGIIRSDGKDNKTFGNGGYDINISADGKKVVYTDFTDIYYIFIAEGIGPIQLTHNTYDTLRYPQFFPDGSNILYEYRRSIYTMLERGGSEPVFLAEGIEPHLCNDGHNVVFLNKDTYELSLLNLDSNTVTILENVNDGLNQRILNPCFFPGDKKIMFECDNSIYVIEKDGKDLKKIAEGTAPFVSTRGQDIIYEYDSKTYVMNINDYLTTQFLEGKVPDFSPAGSQIVFHRLELVN